MHYWDDEVNIGDQLSPYLIQKITGRRCFSARSYEGFYAIGSILNRQVLLTDSVVWGSGTLTRDAFRTKRIKIFPITRSIPKILRRMRPEVQKADIRAVRGPRTRELIINAGFQCPDVFGDPAILMPRFYIPKSLPASKAGLILHHTQESDATRKLAENCGFKAISIFRKGADQLESFVDELCSCEKVFSTSLHGIILAQAYGIPAQWIRVENTPIHKDEDHKFADYFGGVNLPGQTAKVVMLKRESLVELMKIKPKREEISSEMADKLLAAFPSDVFPHP